MMMMMMIGTRHSMALVADRFKPREQISDFKRHFAFATGAAACLTNA
jgi:hypothetical protein